MVSMATHLKTVSEYDQEISQSQIADNPMAPRGRAIQPPRNTRKTFGPWTVSYSICPIFDSLWIG